MIFHNYSAAHLNTPDVLNNYILSNFLCKGKQTACENESLPNQALPKDSIYSKRA